MSNESPYSETIRPIKRANVFWYVFGAFTLSCVGFWALFQALASKEIRWLSVSLAAAAALVMLVDRKRMDDQLSVSVRVSKPVTQEPEPEPREVIRQEVHHTTGNSGYQIKYGQFSFTSTEWQAIAKTLFLAEGRMVRDDFAELVRDDGKTKLFKNIKGRQNGKRVWDDIVVAEFARLGWVNEDTKLLTPDGWQVFDAYLPTPLRHGTLVRVRRERRRRPRPKS